MPKNKIEDKRLMLAKAGIEELSQLLQVALQALAYVSMPMNVMDTASGAAKQIEDPHMVARQALSRIKELRESNSQVKDMIASGEIASMDTPSKIPPKVQLAEQGEIVFDDVSFTYPNSETPALSRVDLTIGAGETIALVGANGSGKTTLAGLIPRLFDPSAGRITLDGADLHALDLVALRRSIGLVSQEAVIFAGTPIENISYGAEAVDRSRAEQAARRAHADDFIRALPGNYEANLGERGTTLSGGQRQRISIARAIYRDAPILIFDEATSQVDSESEQKIQTALRDFAQGRTTIIIAHRLSTIQFANRILVLDGGRVIDTGAHGDLYARCLIYRALCDTQLAGDSDTSGNATP